MARDKTYARCWKAPTYKDRPATFLHYTDLRFPHVDKFLVGFWEKQKIQLSMSSALKLSSELLEGSKPETAICWHETFEVPWKHRKASALSEFGISCLYVSLGSTAATSWQSTTHLQLKDAASSSRLLFPWNGMCAKPCRICASQACRSSASFSGGFCGFSVLSGLGGGTGGARSIDSDLLVYFTLLFSWDTRQCPVRSSTADKKSARRLSWWNKAFTQLQSCPPPRAGPQSVSVTHRYPKWVSLASSSTSHRCFACARGIHSSATTPSIKWKTK